MANIYDQYANAWQYLGAVFKGTLTPFNSSLSAITNIPYRHVSKDRLPVDWEASIGLVANQQPYEIWPQTTYVPNVNDVWSDSAGIKWTVLDVQSSDLVGSNGLPVSVMILTQRQKS